MGASALPELDVALVAAGRRPVQSQLVPRLPVVGDAHIINQNILKVVNTKCAQHAAAVNDQSNVLLTVELNCFLTPV